MLATEWGATNDPAIVTTMADQFDSQLLPWLFWAYDENVILDMSLPPTADNLRGPVLDALTRPYPTAVNGTPTRLAFDGSSRTLEFEYSTTRARWAAGRCWSPDHGHHSGRALSRRLRGDRHGCEGRVARRVRRRSSC